MFDCVGGVAGALHELATGLGSASSKEKLGKGKRKSREVWTGDAI